MNAYAESMLKTSKSKLLGWRKRYDAAEYPRKVAINTVYELVLLEAIWPWIEEHCFNGEALFDSLEDARYFVQETKLRTYIPEVHPQVMPAFANRDRLPNIIMQDYRQCVLQAITGDTEALEVIENTYLMHFTSTYLLYLCAAFGLTGLARDEAIGRVSELVVGSNENFVNLYTMLNLTVQIEFENSLQLKVFAATLKFPR